MEIFGVPLQAMYGQLLLGLVNGSFYAMLSLGLAVIFGLLNIINFTHGAVYMLGAYAAYIGMSAFGTGYWPALILAPLAVGIFGMSRGSEFNRRHSNTLMRLRVGLQALCVALLALYFVIVAV